MHIEVISDQMAEIYRRMTGAQKLAISARMFEAAREMLIKHLSNEHPDWSDEQVWKEATRRVANGPT